MGTPSAAAGKALQAQLADADAFFPSSVKIHVGDSVKFLERGFHTVDFPQRGEGALPLVIPTGTKVSGSNDAGGTPFWFNGQDLIGFNPLLFKSLFGKKVAYSGANRVETGLFLGNGAPKPATVRFTKAGNFTYYCDVHPGMKGVVHVVAKSKKVPSAKADRKAVATQAARAIKTAKSLRKTQVPANTFLVGASGPGGVESLAFYPATLSVPVGTTVLFKMPTSSREDHTATAGSSNIDDPSSYLGKMAATFNGPVPDPAGVYPSEQGTLASLTPTYHGNGFWNSGVLDTSNASPLPSSGSVKFAAAGTYTFHCLIHPFMKATVTVK
jgi:plastocyanin